MMIANQNPSVFQACPKEQRTEPRIVLQMANPPLPGNAKLKPTIFFPTVLLQYAKAIKGVR